MIVHINKSEDIANKIRLALKNQYGKSFSKIKADVMISDVSNRMNELKTNSYRLVIEASVNIITARLYATSSNNKIGNLVYTWNSGFSM